MKNIISIFLLIGLIIIPNILFSQNLIVTIRTSGQNFNNYQKYISSTPGRISPVDYFKFYFNQSPLPEEVTLELKKIESLVSQNQRDKKLNELNGLIKKFIPNQALFLLKNRIESELTINNKSHLENINLDTKVFSHKSSYTNKDKSGSGIKTDYQNQNNLQILNNLEDDVDPIHKSIQKLKLNKGGEDLTLFINGQVWNEKTFLDEQTSYHWALVSSQWSLIHFWGTPSEYIIISDTQLKFKNWIEGTANKYNWSKLSYLKGAQREVFWSEDSISPDSWQTEVPYLSNLDNNSESLKSNNSFWIFTAVAIGLAIISNQTENGKILKFNF